MSDVITAEDNLPAEFELSSYPNPFNPLSRIDYKIPHNTVAKIDIISLTGSVVKSFDQLSDEGYLLWNGTNNNNERVSSGIYCVILRDHNRVYLSRKIVLMK